MKKDGNMLRIGMGGGNGLEGIGMANMFLFMDGCGDDGG